MSFKSFHSVRARALALACSLIAMGCWAMTSMVNAQQPESRDKNAAHQPRQRFYPDDPMWRDDDMRNISPVAEFDLSKSYEFVNETFGETVKSRGPALNVNTLGEVPDSSWFTNRLGQHDMTVDDIVRGPNQVDGPAPGIWHITGRPDAGITPKFTVKDSRGDTYLIKLDPADFPELPSSVEIISTKIFHAIGYYVPEDFIVTFDLAGLDIAPGATIRTVNGEKRSIDMDDVKKWLKNTPRNSKGGIRALASRYVPGKVVGQYRYTGTRPDDPNDIYPHERRRELRGMRVFAAWLNHDDARSINSIDTYVEDNGRRYIRHYLQDFGSNLGSGSTSAQQPRGGNEYLIERDKIGKGLISFGLWRRDWMSVKYPKNPSLGNIEADFFDPPRWKTEYPQPAFDQMDAADAFWAARIASRFTDEMITAIVETGELSDPAAAKYLTDVIIKRRDKVVAYWLVQANPIDGFKIVSTGKTRALTFENAATRLRLTQPGVTYKARWASFDNATGEQRPVGEDATVTDPHLTIPDDAWGPSDASGVRYAAASIQTVSAGRPNWMTPVVVTVRERGGTVDIVGLDRRIGNDASKQLATASER